MANELIERLRDGNHLWNTDRKEAAHALEAADRMAEALEKISRGAEERDCFCGACRQVRISREALAAYRATQKDD